MKQTVIFEKRGKGKKKLSGAYLCTESIFFVKCTNFDAKNASVYIIFKLFTLFVTDDAEFSFQRFNSICDNSIEIRLRQAANDTPLGEF